MSVAQVVCLIFLSLLASLVKGVAVPGPSPLVVPAPKPTFNWATLGDSYASAICWQWFSGAGLLDNCYDHNGMCHRATYAYGYQMKDARTSWLNTEAYSGVNWEFPACSGSRYTDMYSGQNQIGQVGNPEFITLQVGGNDMGFFDIAINCIYQPDSAETYDPQYPEDPNCQGACCQAIQKSQNNIDNALNNALTTTLEEILNAPHVAKARFFYLYLLGYVHFFNVDTTWCNSASFGAFNSNAKLTQQLRTAINNGVQQINSKYNQIITSYKPPANSHLGFVDISPPFNNHRFCEAWGTSQWSQYYDGRLWLWNLSPSWFSGDAVASNLPADTPTQFGNLTSGIFDFGVNVPMYPTPEALMSGGDIPSKLRPFHPTTAGHQAIYEAIVGQLRADKVPFVH